MLYLGENFSKGAFLTVSNCNSEQKCCQASALFVNCSMQNLLQMGLRTSVCKTLPPDFVVPKAHQSDRSYVCELSGPSFDSLLTNLTVGGHMEDPKNH